MKRVIGVFGGTFAPIHHGHLRLAIEALEQLGLNEVRLIPAARPPLRQKPVIDGERRLRWVKLALRDEPELFADDCELQREGPSYTFDTLAALRALHPKASLCLLLGQDQAHKLPQWHRWRELPKLAHLALFHRPGEPVRFPGPVTRLLRGRRASSVGQLRTEPAGLWWRCEMPPLAISASDIRRRLCKGQSVRGLLPDIVIDDFNRKDLEAFAQDEKPAR